MTAILGYIADDFESNSLSMFLASDGLVTWHSEQGDKPENDYNKIYRFKKFLISFNGEVQFYQEFLNSIQQITCNVSSIHELQGEINKIFPFTKFGNNLGRFSKAKYSNIIILDIENRVLAHHYAGNVSRDNSYIKPFDFKFLDNNTLYHFGSEVSLMNDISKTNEAFFIENNEFLGQTIVEQIKLWENCFDKANRIAKGVGRLNSYYILEQDKNEHSSNIDSL